MPHKLYLAAVYPDGSPLFWNGDYLEVIDVRGSVHCRGGEQRELPVRQLKMLEKPGIWEMELDVRNDLKLGNDTASQDILIKVSLVHLTANFTDRHGDRAETNLLLIAHYSPQNHEIKILTITQDASIGIVLHVKTNFFAKSFNYVLMMSKGIILSLSEEKMMEGIQIMEINLTAEMAPVATFVVWHIGQGGTIVSDSLTFPVNGISCNNFTVSINSHKAHDGEHVEVTVFGKCLHIFNLFIDPKCMGNDKSTSQWIWVCHPYKCMSNTMLILKNSKRNRPFLHLN